MLNQRGFIFWYFGDFPLEGGGMLPKTAINNRTYEKLHCTAKENYIGSAVIDRSFGVDRKKSCYFYI